MRQIYRSLGGMNAAILGLMARSALKDPLRGPVDSPPSFEVQR